MRRAMGRDRVRTADISNVVVEPAVTARVRDGTELVADVYRPSTGGPFPTLLLRTPYRRQTGQTSGFRHPTWYARRGYMVVVQDARGRGDSGGDFEPFANEGDDGADAIEWAASLPGSNGTVGTYGFSYPGACQLLAARERPPSLVTMCPGFTGSRYHEGWTYTGGALNLAFVASWSAHLAAESARRRGDDEALRALDAAWVAGPARHYPHLPLDAYPPFVEHRDDVGYYFDWLAHPSYDDYWRRWSIDEDYGRIDVPAFHPAGWYDTFLGGTVRNFAGLRAGAGSEAARTGQKLVVGPWYHVPWSSRIGDVDFGPAARETVDDWQLRWFDRFLRGEETGVLDTPATVFVMGENAWHELEDWPPPGVAGRDLFLHSEGAANSADGDGRLSFEEPGPEVPDVFVSDPLAPTPSAGGRSCCHPLVAPMGPVDQAGVEALNRVLVYTSEPLAGPLTLVGPVSATVFVATDAPDTDVTVKLCDVGPDGRSINVCGGVLRARYRRPSAEPAPLAPGEVAEYRVHLGPTAIRFAAGHRLRVQVSSSDFPQFDRNLQTGGPLFAEEPTAARFATNTVLHERGFGSRLTLPVVEG
jgi:putative CocE/NonD family hydrolase